MEILLRRQLSGDNDLSRVTSLSGQYDGKWWKIGGPYRGVKENENK